MHNRLSWFELFVADLSRARAFYEQAFATTLKHEVFNGEPHAIFTAEGVAGALVERRGRGPSADGAIVYFDVKGALDETLARVVPSGGAVLMPKTDIGPPGFIALIRDSEGNQVGLHAPRG